LVEEVSVAEVKSRFSEYVAKVAYTHQRLIITKRNKPIAALVDLNTLQRVENKNERRGLASIIGKWRDSEDLAENIENVIKTRKKEKIREVSF